MANSYPDDWYCAITQEIMVDPVIGTDGQTQERAAIEEWLGNHGTSPMTRAPMTVAGLIPNRALANTIRETVGERGVTEGTRAAPAVEGAGARIVLCVDVSGSMSSEASIGHESDGLSRLDLVKHALRTLVAGLGDDTVLSVVEYTDSASVVAHAARLTAQNRRSLDGLITGLRAKTTTNLQDGLRVSLEQTRRMGEGRKHIIVFTDGHSNRDPPRGILDTLQRDVRRSDDVAIHTLGFGYDINSGLLTEVAQACNGVFGFIPDASMVGTVFINLCVSIVQGALEAAVDEDYGGEPRQIVRNQLEGVTRVHSTDAREAALREASRALLDETMEPREWRAAVLMDLMSDDPNSGQLGKSVAREDWQERWGRHQLRSMLTAHERGVCLNFKDAALQLQKSRTPGFDAKQEVFEQKFLGLPAPVPAVRRFRGGNAAHARASSPVRMTDYQDSAGGCFAGWTIVGERRVDELRPGDEVMSANGLTRVAYIVETRLAEAPDLRMPGDGARLGLTPWHPVFVEGRWQFPAEIAGWVVAPAELRSTMVVQNIVLENRVALMCGEQAESDELRRGASPALAAATLGHGMTGPVIGHEYFGSDRIVADIAKMARDGVAVIDGTRITRGENRTVTSFAEAGLSDVIM